MISYEQAFNNYYSLKKKYQVENNKLIDKLLINKTLTKEEKNNIFKSKKKCINCQKLGGTIFEEDKNKLIARCGNLENPCNLNIILERSINYDIINEIDNTLIFIGKLKEEIIKIKLNFLYNFTDENSTKELFDKIKNDLIEITNHYKKLIINYNKIYNNEIKNNEIINLDNELNINIDKFKEVIDFYKKDFDVEYIKEAVSIYKDFILKINKELLEKKYNINYIFFDDNDNLNYLIQEKNKYGDKIITINNSENKIIDYSQ